MDDAKLMELIRKILNKGNDAEVKLKKDGEIAIYEIKKNKVTA